MIRIFEAFLDKMKAAFRRIAGATRHEMTVGDLHGDAWIVAHEIGERRGREIDFANPEDQELVLGAVHVRNVKRGDWKMRRAVRIDQEPENEDAVIKWSERLPARASSDPLVSLLARESSLKTEELLAASYSQAAAYVMVFVRFKNDRSAVCAYLVLSDGTLARRVTSAAASVRVQPSLFDYVERIHDEFMPQPGRQYALRAEQEPESTQRAWNF